MKFSLSNFDPQITISTAEILEISQEINRDFSPLLPVKTNNTIYNKNISPQEMLDISETVSLNFAPKMSNNQTQLMLLPVDPNHIYAYWNPNKDNSFPMEKNDRPPQELTLRIYSTSPSDAEQNKTSEWQDVIVDNTKFQQSIPLPVIYQHNSYCASLGKREENNNLIPFARSNITAFTFGKTALLDKQDGSTLLLSHNDFVNNHQENVPLLTKSSSGQRFN